MLSESEDALFCDMAETYGIFDTWEEFADIRKYAVLAVGLRDNSRIKMALNNAKIDLQTTLQAATLDVLKWIQWSKTEDAQHNTNRPKPILDILTGSEKQKSNERMLFESPEDFERELERLQTR